MPAAAVALLGGGVTQRQLRYLADRGEVRIARVPGGHRRYSKESILELRERIVPSSTQREAS